MKLIVYLLMGLILPLLTACGESAEDIARREQFQRQEAFVAACQTKATPQALAAQGFGPAEKDYIPIQVADNADSDQHFRALWRFDKPQGQWQCVYTRRVLTYDHNSCRRQMEYTIDGKRVWAWKSVLFRGDRCNSLYKEYTRNGWLTTPVPAY